MRNPIPRCVDCFRIVDVQPIHDIYLQDDGMRDGHYFAVYAYGQKKPYCAKCRHRYAAFVRLVGMQQRDGFDVCFSNQALKG